MRISDLFPRRRASLPRMASGLMTAGRKFALPLFAVLLLAVLSTTAARAEISVTFTGGVVPASGATRKFAVRVVRNADATAIHAVDIALEYDAEVLAITDVIAAGGTTGWEDPAWSADSGILRVAQAGAEALTGSALFEVVIRAAVNPSVQSTTVRFGRIEFNDGVTAVGTGSTITLDGVPITIDGVSVTPTSATLREGESLVLAAIVDTNGDPAVDWSFGDGFEIGQLFPSGLYVAPPVLTRSREIVVRATSRLHPDFYAEASLTLLPVIGAAQPELWITTNPANPRLLDVYVGTGTNPDAIVRILVGGVALPVTAVGSPVSAYHATVQAAPSAVSLNITAEIDATSISRTITF